MPDSPPTKELGMEERLANCDRAFLEAWHRAEQAEAARDALVLVAEAVANGEWEAARELSDAALERTP